MKEVIIVLDRFNYSGSKIVAVVAIKKDELPHVTFDKWSEGYAKDLNKDKDWVIKSHDFVTQDVQEV